MTARSTSTSRRFCSDSRTGCATGRSSAPLLFLWCAPKYCRGGACGDYVIRDVMQNYTSGANDGVASDRDPCSDGHCGAEPYVVADGYRMSSFPPLPPSPVVVDGVEGRHQLCAGSDASVISDCDHGVVHEERVGVDERSSSEPNVVAVAALKPRHDDGVVTEAPSISARIPARPASSTAGTALNASSCSEQRRRRRRSSSSSRYHSPRSNARTASDMCTYSHPGSPSTSATWPGSTHYRSSSGRTAGTTRHNLLSTKTTGSRKIA